MVTTALPLLTVARVIISYLLQVSRRILYCCRYTTFILYYKTTTVLLQVCMCIYSSSRNIDLVIISISEAENHHGASEKAKRIVNICARLFRDCDNVLSCYFR